MKQRFILFTLLLAMPLLGVGAENSVLKNTPTLTLELATRMMDVASRRAEELNEKVSIVIVGADGLPLTIRRHEENPGLIYEQALGNAQAAWLEKKETVSGLPVLSGNQRLGGIGIAGASENPNKEIGTVALNIFKETLKKNIPLP